MFFRCFDLGGSGLRTCLVNEINDHCESTLIGCSDSPNIASWVREKVQTLNQEIANDTFFSFCLAGLDKLSSIGLDFQNKRDPKNIAKLFDLPVARVITQNDGDAHLRASQSLLKVADYPHINFSIGTGVSFGLTNKFGDLESEESLYRVCGCAPWDLLADCEGSKRKVCRALAKEGFDKLKANKDDSALISTFESRWLKFLNEVLFPKFKTAGWRLPIEVSFTGGIVDNNALWMNETQIAGYRIRRGPKNGGLLGAAVIAQRVFAGYCRT